MGAPKQMNNSFQEAKQTASSPTKTVYFIRHAESDENRRRFSLEQCLQNIVTGNMPSTEDINASFELLNVPAQVDSDVSEVGAQQIAHMGQLLEKQKFLEQTGIQLVVHSPLLRARRTCEGLLGCVVAAENDDTNDSEGEKTKTTKKAPTISRVEELDILRERAPHEVPEDVILKEIAPKAPSNFTKRIEQFERWLHKQPEDVVAIVGHSNHFRSLLNLPYKFKNCEVWKATFDPTALEAESVSTPAATAENNNGRHPTTWSQIERIYECEVYRQTPERQQCM